MKRILLSLLSIFALCTYIFATPISEGEAREKAMQFMLTKKGSSSARSAQRFGGSAGAGFNLTMAEAQEAFYVFNIDSVGGYVIVSGDDRMPDVLGYSYSSTYNADDIPDNMRAWLDGYAEQYEYLRSHKDAQGVSLTTVDGDEILPMIECHWDQNSPYNNQCPMINGKRAVTGCVATAMAQIMYYHQWPEQTTKEIPAYTTDTQGLQVPAIGVTTIDWDNMMPTYSSYSSEVRKKAVSTLMRLCGSAVEMDYGLNVSNAFGNMAMMAFVNYFGYNSFSISNDSRNGYDDAVWNQMIYDELKDGRPIFYSGQNPPNGGHAFIVDGYDSDDYFHINWGWGGYADDYFLLGALRGYNYDQYAMTGIDNGQSDAKCTYAVLDEDGVLTYYYDNESGSREGTLLNWNCWNWDTQDYKQQITKAVFDPSCADYKYLSSTGSMFDGCTNLVSVQGLEYLNTENVTDMGWMFYGCSSLESADVSHFNTEKVTSMCCMFYDCNRLETIDVSHFNTEKVTDMGWMFYGCESVKVLDVSGFNTENVTNMCSMFCGCSSLESLDVSHFNTSNVTNMGWMFDECESLTTLDVSSFNTSNVTDMTEMFRYCTNLTTIDVSNFDTSNNESFGWMFCGCSSLENVDVSHFNTDNATIMTSMFWYCQSLKDIDVTSFNTENVTDIGWMFCGCESMTSLDISNFNTQNVTNMSYMFYGCYDMQTIYVGDNWTTDNVTESEGMFNYCFSLIGQAGTEYDYYGVQDKTYARIDGGAEEPGYFTYKAPKLRGDANSDGEIGMPDVMFIVNYILGTPAETFDAKAADANLDGEIGMPDVMFIVNYILNGMFPDE